MRSSAPRPRSFPPDKFLDAEVGEPAPPIRAPLFASNLLRNSDCAGAGVWRERGLGGVVYVSGPPLYLAIYPMFSSSGGLLWFGISNGIILIWV